jgi:hypothetical protein
MFAGPTSRCGIGMNYLTKKHESIVTYDKFFEHLIQICTV